MVVLPLRLKEVANLPAAKLPGISRLLGRDCFNPDVWPMHKPETRKLLETRQDMKQIPLPTACRRACLDAGEEMPL